MVEYLYDAIRAVAGADNMINAYITDENNEIITDGCYLVIHSGGATDIVIAKIEGKYDSELSVWEFLLDTDLTRGLKGRYLYCIMRNDTNLCFKQPIYFL